LPGVFNDLESVLCEVEAVDWERASTEFKPPYR
jgi:hypothetical protein